MHVFDGFFRNGPGTTKYYVTLAIAIIASVFMKLRGFQVIRQHFGTSGGRSIVLTGTQALIVIAIVLAFGFYLDHQPVLFSFVFVEPPVRSGNLISRSGLPKQWPAAVRIVMPAGKEISEHEAPGEIIVPPSREAMMSKMSLRFFVKRLESLPSALIT